MKETCSECAGDGVLIDERTGEAIMCPVCQGEGWTKKGEEDDRTD